MKPMLSATIKDVESLSYPLMASPKLDGIRALILPGLGIVSRNLKPIQNHFLRMRFSHPSLFGLDGELILGDHDHEVFRRTSSAVMSYDGEPDVKFYMFDITGMPNTTFRNRYSTLSALPLPSGHHCKIVPHFWVDDPKSLRAYEEKCLDEGYEGVMLRNPDGLYKEGRSTLNQGWLMKLKRFEDAEAEIIGFEERMHNGNVATTDALGHTERSSHQAGMTGRGDLGALVVRGINGPYKGVGFNIGTGFDDNDRDWFWAHRETLLGRTVKYKYFPMGSKDAPRFPVYLGIRQGGI